MSCRFKIQRAEKKITHPAGLPGQHIRINISRLAEKDKTVEILELETEEERLRTHRLQARILQVEASLT